MDWLLMMYCQHGGIMGSDPYRVLLMMYCQHGGIITGWDPYWVLHALYI